jgi:hypothetical protein
MLTRSLSLPSSLDESHESYEENKLMTVIVSYDGSYEDDQGEQQQLFNTVLRAIRSMTECQKVMIVEKESEEGKEGEVRETRIWSVHFPIWTYVADTIP